jgi:alkyldihydroxyacetonephosphate synthase
LKLAGPRPAGGPPALPPAALAPAPIAALRKACADLDDGEPARLAHAAGMSTEDLLELRAGHVAGAPDAVARPASHDEVVAVLRAATEHRIAVVPFGGGTSVVGGLRAARAGFAGVLALDLTGMSRLLAVDATSRTATFEAGVRGPDAEACSPGTASRWATTRSRSSTRRSAASPPPAPAGQASSGYGRFDQMVLGLRAATPVGTLDVGRAPQSAAGPTCGSGCSARRAPSASSPS